MKQTVNINLNGIVFHVDDDACGILQEYLHEIEHYLGNNEDTTDVLKDIEARIGELFTLMLQQKGVQVVNEEMVRQVMERLGSPTAFADEDSDGEANTEHRTVTKRLYRDEDNELLGGVCSGLSSYFGIDAVWFRLLFVFFTIVYGAAFFLYILLWVIVPAARTAAQRLEMRGVEPSVNNIEQEVKRTKEEEPSNKGCLRSGISLALKGFVGISLLFTVPVVLFAIFIIGVVLVALVGALFGAVPGVITSTFPFHAMASEGEIYSILFFLLFSLSTILIPIIMLVHWLITNFRKHTQVSKRFWWTTSILWVISLFGLGGATIYAGTHNFNTHFSIPTDDVWDDDYATITRFDELDAFHSIVVAGNADIDLSQNPVQTVTMQTSRPDLYKVSVIDSVLYIECKETRLPLEVDFTIAMPEVRRIVSSGACSIEGVGVLNVTNLYIQASGAAEIDLNVVAKELTLHSSGASETDFKGITDHLFINLSGAGEVDAEKLQARTAEVICSGAGKVEVNVTDTLSAQASGASKIEYRGNPTLSKNITGGMSVIRQSR